MSIITITRGTKSGGLELANRLSKKLGYKSIGREDVISESAKQFNVMEEFLLSQLDKTPSLWQKFTNEYVQYICFIQCSLLQFIKEDNIIYHGHAGQFLLKGLPSVLKLRIEAPLEYRVRSVMEESDYSYDKAVEYINKVDDQRKRWVKMVYNQEWCDPSLYDMCFNLQNMSMDNICGVVELAIDHDDFKTTEKSIRLINNLELECKVKAALLSDNKISAGHPVTVSAHDGVVILKGSVKNEHIKDLILDTTSKVKGVKNCESQINLLSDEIH
jgi:cytidylate kinase